MGALRSGIAALRPAEDRARSRGILFLAHRIPYPPDKGDKIRSFHFLRHLAERAPVRLGCFVDDPADMEHLDALRTLCVEVFALPLPRRRLVLALPRALALDAPVTMAHYRSRAMAAWVGRCLARGDVGTVLAFSGAMAQYLPGATPGVRRVLDLVDVDSRKWADYAADAPWPLRALYRREARTLAAAELAAAARADQTVLISPRERELFLAGGGVDPDLVGTVGNGVDLERFRPGLPLPAPFPPGQHPIVMTGAMDYRANVDGALWFARDVLPRLRSRLPGAVFWIVGSNPAPALRRLDGVSVRVTGRVPDIRPWLAGAACVVAPLRVARGQQNKALEAMAMARPLVATAAVAAGICARDGRDLVVADTAGAMADSIERLIRAPEEARALGDRARRRMVEEFGWDTALERLDAVLDLSPLPADRVA